MECRSASDEAEAEPLVGALEEPSASEELTGHVTGPAGDLDDGPGS